MTNQMQPEPISALALFNPAPGAVYSIDEAARLTRIPRRLIAVYFRYGLVSLPVEPEAAGWYFDNDGIRTLRQIERLRSALGMSLAAVKLVLELNREVEHLRQEVRFLRRL